MSTEAIVYGEAVRAIAGQERTLAELRTRTATVLAAGGVASAFLGDTGIADGAGLFAWLAIVAFALMVGACVWVLIPVKEGWTFECSAGGLLEDHVDVAGRNKPQLLYRFLAEALDGHYKKNEKPLEHRMTAFWWACIGLATTIGLWLLELGVN